MRPWLARKSFTPSSTASSPVGKGRHSGRMVDGGFGSVVGVGGGARTSCSTASEHVRGGG